MSGWSIVDTEGICPQCGCAYHQVGIITSRRLRLHQFFVFFHGKRSACQSDHFDRPSPVGPIDTTDTASVADTADVANTADAANAAGAGNAVNAANTVLVTVAGHGPFATTLQPGPQENGFEWPITANNLVLPPGHLPNRFEWQ